MSNQHLKFAFAVALVSLSSPSPASHHESDNESAPYQEKVDVTFRNGCRITNTQFCTSWFYSACRDHDENSVVSTGEMSFDGFPRVQVQCQCLTHSWTFSVHDNRTAADLPADNAFYAALLADELAAAGSCARAHRSKVATPEATR